MSTSYTGGCQCGAVRYRFNALGRASICHCRMCQKAMGNYFAPLVEVEGFKWTRGERSLFASSNLSNRGFCPTCGTPLTLETDDAEHFFDGYKANAEYTPSRLWPMLWQQCAPACGKSRAR